MSGASQSFPRLTAVVLLGICVLLLARSSSAQDDPTKDAFSHITLRAGAGILVLKDAYKSYRVDDSTLIERDEVKVTGGFLFGPSVGWQWTTVGFDIYAPLLFVPFDDKLQSKSAFAPGLTVGVSFISVQDQRPGLLTVFVGGVCPFLSGPDDALLAKSDATIQARNAGTCQTGSTGVCAGITAEDLETKTKSTPIPSFVAGIGLGF